MAKAKKKSNVYSVVYMIVLTAICAFLLGLLSEFTRPAVAANREIEVQSAILDSVGIEYTEENIGTIFDETVTELDAERLIYKIDDGASIQGYSFYYIGGALWGDVEGYIGITEDYSELLGVSITNNNETPGLGGRITETWFLEQFRGIPVVEGDFIVYSPNQGANMDAISGATQTSASFRTMIINSVHEFIDTMQGAQ